MTDAEATALEILKWAISPSRPAPEVQEWDEEPLFKLAVHHRILGPLVARLDAARPAWCPPRFRTRLRIKQHETRKKVQANLNAACEISRAMRARGLAPPIFVKGFAAYALTANPEIMHYSGDLDPFAEDLPAFETVLHEIGYSGKRKDTHEWAKLSRNGVTLDIHQHFPMLAYPHAVPLLPLTSLEARQNPGRWHLPEEESRLPFREAQIRWRDLSTDAVPGAAAGTEELLLPSPAHLCLIHCAHCFRVSMTRLQYMDLFGGFRLYELLSLYTLARMPSFNANQFSSLVEQFSAQDAVRLVNALAVAALGEKAVPEQGRSEGSEESLIFPERLMYGGWMLLQKTEDWLLLRGFEQMLVQLDAASVPASSRLNAADAPRLLTYGQSPPLPQIDVVWEQAQKSLMLDWAFLSTLPGHSRHELLIHFGYGSFVQVLLNAGLSIDTVFRKSDYGSMNGNATETLSADGRPMIRVTCSVPRHPLHSVSDQADLLPLFLAVRRLGPDGETTQAVTYLPLVLHP